MPYPKIVNLSLPKTGSTTIYEAFKGSGAVHEGFHDLTVDKIIDYYEKTVSYEQLRAFLIRRQKLLKTSLDSSTFMHLIPRELTQLYPASTIYVCVIRHPCDWARSYLSMLYEIGRDLLESQKQQDLQWTTRYAGFQAKSLDPICLYKHADNTDMLLSVIQELCSYWHQSLTRVHGCIDPGKLLSSSIENLPGLIQAIAPIIGAEPSSLPHSNRNRAPLAIQDSIQHACSLAVDNCDSVSRVIDHYNQLLKHGLHGGYQ